VYSQKIILQQAQKVESTYNVDLLRYSVEQSVARQRHINSIYDEEGNLTRRLSPEEAAFIQNELLLCKIDFEYFFERYVFLQIDDNRGGVRRSKLLESQQILLRKLAVWEEDMWVRYRRGEIRLDGLCVLIHKARQLGFTMFCQAMLAHRTVFYAGYRALTASVEDDKTQDVHIRFTTIIDRLPRWMIPVIASRQKDKGMIFDHTGEKSKMMLQDSMQQKGLGQGEQWDGVHFTEVASWPNARETIQNHFFPTVATSIRAMAFMESTAQGMGNWWHKATEQARKGRLDRWRYCFVPWYAEKNKYMAYPSPDWAPNAETVAMANRIESTSREFMGYDYSPTREQLYWYERAYSAAIEDRSLNYFLANFCATPEESFQHSGVSIFSAERLQLLRSGEATPSPYIVQTPQNRLMIPQEALWTTSGAPKELVADPDHRLLPLRPDHEFSSLEDPRGLVLLWERPSPRESYFLGADAAEGISGWERALISTKADDEEKDNSAIQLISKGRTGGKGERPAQDRQIAEFAAPVEPEVFAPIIHTLGKVFRGLEDTECLANIETYPTPAGAITQRELMQKFRYSNFLPWVVFESGKIQQTGKFGFRSDGRSVPQLWVSGKQHVHSVSGLIRSRYLLSEMSYCKYDPIKQRGMAMDGWHDDRVTAYLLALWAAHNWAVAEIHEIPEPDSKSASVTPGVELRDMDIGFEDMEQLMDDWMGM
jgi:hypothetical protein